jgi:surface antigen
MDMRTTKPTAGNLFYITQAKGGYSTCIQGKPIDGNCNVLSNCVGYACGRFNEIIGTMKYPSLNCNAENFIERARSLGLTVEQKPSLGAIMCWSKGKAGNSSDGAGHVAIVERVDNDNQVLTSESNYGGTAFFNQTRTNNNGRWGLGSTYTFRGFIVNPGVREEESTPMNYIGKPVQKDPAKNQLYVTGAALRARSNPNLGSSIYGYFTTGYYDVLEERDMRSEASNGYVWYKTGEGFWGALIEGQSTYIPASATPEPTPDPQPTPDDKADWKAAEALLLQSLEIVRKHTA